VNIQKTLKKVSSSSNKLKEEKPETIKQFGDP
jgi:hypothetical protein